MSSAKINNIQLEYQTLGNREDVPLVLIRGLGTQLIDWSEVFLQTLVDAGLYVVTFDNRDVGLSQKFDEVGPLANGKQPAAYAATDMAADVIGLMDHLGLDKVHLFGISMGGMIAQLCAYEYPDRLISMMSVMSSSSRKGLPQATPKAQQAMSAIPDPAGGKQAVIDLVVESMEVFGSPGYPESLSLRQVLAENQYERCYNPNGVNRQMAALIKTGNRIDKLRQISVPTTVIHGTGDALIPIACGRDTAELIPNANFIAVEGMGHNIPDDLADEMTTIVMAHIKDTAGMGNTI